MTTKKEVLQGAPSARTARVCARHMQYCQNGECPYCEPPKSIELPSPASLPLPPRKRAEPTPTCPHYGLSYPSYSFIRNEPPMSVRCIQIALMRPDDCPKCAMERIGRLRGSLEAVLSTLAGLKVYGTHAEQVRSKEVFDSALQVYLGDRTKWWGP